MLSVTILLKFVSFYQITLWYIESIYKQKETQKIRIYKLNWETINRLNQLQCNFLISLEQNLVHNQNGLINRFKCMRGRERWIVQTFFSRFIHFLLGLHLMRVCRSHDHEFFDTMKCIFQRLWCAERCTVHKMLYDFERLHSMYHS